MPLQSEKIEKRLIEGYMNILIVLPWAEDYKLYRDRFSRYLTYAPLTLVTLAALVPDSLNANVEICDEMVQKVNYDKAYDVVAISFVTPSSYRAYHIAEKFRSKGTHVVFGGYHTTFMPEEAKQYADTIIIGRAEGVFNRFLLDFAAGKAQSVYQAEASCTVPYTVPRRHLLPRRGYLNVPAFIANPGCPNRCEYCAISAMNSPKNRMISDIISEIKALGTRRLLFFDPNFFQNKNYVLELMSELEKLNVKWACNATVTNAFDEEIIKAAQKSGCSGVLLGLESLNKSSLKSVSKGFNDPAHYKRAIEIFQSHQISVNGCFVLGFDQDERADLTTLPEQVDYLGLNLARYAILTPVPNTKLFNRLDREGRILTRDWSKYTQNQAVFQPINMTANELEAIYKKVWRDTYKLSKVLWRASKAPTLETKAILLGANLGFKYVADHIDI